MNFASQLVLGSDVCVGVLAAYPPLYPTRFRVPNLVYSR